MVPGVPSGDRGNWYKNRYMTEAVHEFNRLKALITLEQVNTSVVRKKRMLISKTSMVRPSGRVF